MNYLHRHSGGRPFSCDLCKNKFSLKSNLKSHLRIHTGERPFACELCEKKFAQKSHLKIHLLKHTGDRPFACELCEKKFSLKGNLKSHLRKHTGDQPFACDLCDKKYSQKNNLKNHRLKHTGDKPFTCDLCDKKFAVKGWLKQHLLYHTGYRPFTCDLCHKKYTRKYHLEIHKLQHTRDQPFTCDLCDKNFALKSSLKRHLPYHTERRPFACDFCDKKLAYKSGLKRHLLCHAREYNQKSHQRIHTGHRSFSCDLCKHNFSQKIFLKRHLVQHAADLSFPFDGRDKGVRQFGNEKHLLQKVDQPFVCELCNKKFTQISALKSHLLRHAENHSFFSVLCSKNLTSKDGQRILEHKEARSLKSHSYNMYQKINQPIYDVSCDKKISKTVELPICYNLCSEKEDLQHTHDDWHVWSRGESSSLVNIFIKNEISKQHTVDDFSGDPHKITITGGDTCVNANDAQYWNYSCSDKSSPSNYLKIEKFEEDMDTSTRIVTEGN